jgi:hypothetical protein
MKRIGNVDCDRILACPPPDESLKIVKLAIEKRGSIPASILHELLLAMGAFRPEAAKAFPHVQGVNVVPDLAAMVLQDPNFVLTKRGVTSTQRVQPTYELVSQVRPCTNTRLVPSDRSCRAFRSVMY